jgi:putative transposase
MNVGQRESRSIGTLCLLLGYSRQALYQHTRREEKQALEDDLLLQQVVAYRRQMPRCGARKLFELLKPFMQEHQIAMGRDGLFNLLRKHRLLVRSRKRRYPVTTFSHHWLRKYPNLISHFIPVGPNQLWVSDITYVQVARTFAYLSLITDKYSRKIVGYYLSEDLKAEGCIVALQTALQQLPAGHGLIHHSDRGVQYCSEKYVALLTKKHIRISMTESGNPQENAVAERANGIVKDEFLTDQHFENMDQAAKAVAIAISTYNYVRPHLSINMLTPEIAHRHNGEIKKRWKSYSNRKEVAMT